MRARCHSAATESPRGLRGPRDAEAAGVLHVLAGPAEEFMPRVSMLRDPVALGEALNAPTHTGPQ